MLDSPVPQGGLHASGNHPKRLCTEYKGIALHYFNSHHVRGLRPYSPLLFWGFTKTALLCRVSHGSCSLFATMLVWSHPQSLLFSPLSRSWGDLGWFFVAGNTSAWVLLGGPTFLPSKYICFCSLRTFSYTSLLFCPIHTLMHHFIPLILTRCASNNWKPYLNIY